MLIRKDEWERKIFGEFAEAACLAVDPGSITSGQPPQPDIRFTVCGVEHWTELVEITDQDLARRQMTSLKTGIVAGGFFSQRTPLERSIRSKAAKTYMTNGSRLDLLAYYDKQYPAVSVEPDLIQQTMGKVAADMIASGVWSRVWVYDGWNRQVLWAFPDAALMRRYAG
jgi:hypothetical protein